MIREMYTIYDRVSGTYSDPVYVVNQLDCKRRINAAYRDNPFAIDLELYFVGAFNCANGILTSAQPEFIASVTDIIKEFDHE